MLFINQGMSHGHHKCQETRHFSFNRYHHIIKLLNDASWRGAITFACDFAGPARINHVRLTLTTLKGRGVAARALAIEPDRDRTCVAC